MLFGSLGSLESSSAKSSEYWMAGFENCATLKRPSDTELAKNAKLRKKKGGGLVGWREERARSRGRRESRGESRREVKKDWKAHAFSWAILTFDDFAWL